MHRRHRKEVIAYALTGLVVTFIDYILLNILRFAFGIPLLVSNLFSASMSSFISYKFNKRIVFVDREHSKKKTFVLYVAIISFGIVILQGAALYILSDGVFTGVAASLSDSGLPFSPAVIDTNIAKVIASVVAASWNFFMLRTYVFKTRQ